VGRNGPLDRHHRFISGSVDLSLDKFRYTQCCAETGWKNPSWLLLPHPPNHKKVSSLDVQTVCSNLQYKPEKSPNPSGSDSPTRWSSVLLIALTRVVFLCTSIRLRPFYSASWCSTTCELRRGMSKQKLPKTLPTNQIRLL
jgi:hypothetical protein